MVADGVTAEGFYASDRKNNEEEKVSGVFWMTFVEATEWGCEFLLL
jgi:hypothetical protein